MAADLLQHVRRAAVSALSTAAHNKPGLVKDLLPTLLPLLYDQTVVKVGKIGMLFISLFTSIILDWKSLLIAKFLKKDFADLSVFGADVLN